MTKKTHQKIIIVSILLLSTIFVSNIPSTQAQLSSFDIIDEFIQEQMSNMLIPGIAYGIVQDNDTVYSNAFGKANNNDTEMTVETPMILGGLGKSFISTAIMQLVEANNISLDQSIQSILPSFKVEDPSLSQLITVEQCLYHFTGIPASTGIQFLSNDTFEDIIQKYETIQLSSSPGSKFLYSNYNYILLVAIIENVTNSSFNKYLQTNIAAPLEMDNLYVSIENAQENGLSYGYQPWFGFQQVSNKEYNKQTITSEGLIASAEDMTHFMVAHLNEGVYNNKTILNQENIQKTHNIPENNMNQSYYSMGWSNHTLDEYNVVSIFGNLDDTYADMMIIPSKGIGAVVLINTNNFLGQIAYYQELVPSILKLLLEEEPTVRKLTFVFLYVIIDLLIILSITYEGSRYLKFEDHVNKFLKDFKDPKERRSQAIGKTITDFIIVPLILLGVPAIISLIMGIPGFNQRTLMTMQPDLGIWIIFFGCSALIQGILRIVYFRKKNIY